MPVWLASLALKLSPVGAFLKDIPRWVWIALAVVALLAGGYLWHGHKVRALVASTRLEQKTTDDAAWKAKLDAAVAALAAKNVELANISDQLRKANDDESRRIHDDASAVLVRGPGKATCGSVGRPAATAGQPVAPGAKPDAAGSEVLADERAAVPWGWLVTRAEEHDVDRAEVIAWRDWYAKMLAAWPKASPAAK